MPTYKPALDRLSTNQLSILTGKAFQTVKIALSGLEPIAKDGRTLLYAPAEALSRIYGAKAESERERLDRARAEAQEMQNKVARGEYAQISLISDCLADVSSQIRSILGALPKRLKASLPGLRAPEMDIIKREISQAQRAMAACRPRNLG
jgi:phage terminase Nu1 subunit (DNA packaging protein)